MRLYFYILFIVFLFFGCAAKKKTDKALTVSTELISDESIVSGKKALSSWNDLFSFRESEDIDVIIKIYDTTAPPDSTGKYPLKEEQTIRSARNTEKNQASTGAKKEEDQKTEIRSTESKTQSDEHLQTGYSVAVAGGNSIIWLWVFLAVAGILVLYSLIKKLGKR